ncbi:site-specific integrase [Flavicella sp.]|uniref:site-specific integrase n=1 Tax=Flavicella sp. TaxID=2957742 RepID=UPI0026228ED7|nr:site-specific integrase [Flavicella sp.]MDG1804232.1 site-specific integrase [Flavicella sp.]
MKSSTTFSILIWINSSRAINNQAELYGRVTINQKRTNISLKRKIDISSWDKSKSKVKGNSQEARALNQNIDTVKAKIVQSYQTLELENKLITPQLVKARFFGTDVQHHSLKDIFKYHNENVEHKIHKNTLRSYRTSQRYIQEFIEEKCKTTDMYLTALNHEFIIGFERFLRNYVCKETKRTIANNTAMKHIQRLKKMVNMAISNEWLDKDPFVRFKFSLEKREREFLTATELTFIENYTSKIPRLDLVKDLFIFSCYTGLAYIDIIQLTPDNIHLSIDGNNWLITKRQKTKISVRLPLLEVPKTILEKYQTDIRILSKNMVFPNISNQKVNSYLKEIADICGVSKNLTFHMARHTFATTITLSNGVPIETVSKMLGHTKITTTQIYAKVIERKVSQDMNNLRSILENKKEISSINTDNDIYNQNIG